MICGMVIHPSGSPVDHLLCGFAIAVALYLDLRRQLIEIAKIILCQLDIDRIEVFFETVELCRSRDRNYPVRPGQYPRKCDLRRRRSFGLREAGYPVDECLVRLSCLGGESRHAVA